MMKLSGQYRTCPVPGAVQCQGEECGKYIHLGGRRGVCSFALIAHSFLDRTGATGEPIQKGQKLCGFKPGISCTGEECMLYFPSDSGVGYCLVNAMARSSTSAAELTAIVNAMEQRELKKEQADDQKQQKAEAEKRREEETAKKLDDKHRKARKGHEMKRSTVARTEGIRKHREEKRKKRAAGKAR